MHHAWAFFFGPHHQAWHKDYVKDDGRVEKTPSTCMYVCMYVGLCAKKEMPPRQQDHEQIVEFNVKFLTLLRLNRSDVFYLF